MATAGSAVRVLRAILSPLALAVLAGASAGGGCARAAGGESLELSGAEALERLPNDVRPLVPADAILCLDETGQNGLYHLWILRKPGGTWLNFPTKLRGFEQHDMPPTALEGVLRSKLPRLERGTPTNRRCRFTHWHGEGKTEIQIRELVTDRGWFASIESVKP